jgi:hypothetical protein
MPGPLSRIVTSIVASRRAAQIMITPPAPIACAAFMTMLRNAWFSWETLQVSGGTSSYDLHANCYITKYPVDFDSFIEVIRSIDQFWLALVTLPPRSDDQ